MSLFEKKRFSLRLMSLVAFCLISISGIAQTAPFTYQAVVRNSQNEIVTNTTIGVRISLLRNSPSDPAEFAERHVVQTNANGLFTLLVGTGSYIFGNISTIDWSAYTYYLKCEIDPTGGTYYTITGTQLITGVPFAYYSLSTNYTEQQVISISNDTIFLTGGTNSFAKLPVQNITIPDSVSAFINDAGYITADSIPTNVSAFNNDAGYITSADIPTNVSAFNNDAGYITSYVDSQQLAISNDTITLDRGGFVKLPAVTIPSNVSQFNNDAGYITSDSIPSNVSAFNNDAGYITSAAIPTNVSAFNNDSGYITAYVDSQQLAISNDTISLDRGGFVKLPVVNIPSNVSQFNNDAGYITIDSIPSNVSAFNNDAGYITSADIPTNVSAFNNDAGYITAYVDSQQISISNDTISLDRGGFVKLPAQTPSCCALADSLKAEIDSLIKDFEDLKKTLSAPSVQTLSILSTTIGGATVSGNVTAQGGATVSDRGICWSTSPAPTLANSYTSSGSGLGAFSGTASGLSKNTTYYVRAYASNLFGTGYGNELSFTTCKDTIIVIYDTIIQGLTYNWRGHTYSTTGSYYDSLLTSEGCDSIYQLDLFVAGLPNCGTVTDYDGNTYNTLQIGNQCWMRENLKTTHYEDGTLIQLGSTTSSSVAYRYYPGNSSAYVSDYGYLYNWRATMGKSPSASINPSGVQGVCPNGWHVPSDAEWTELTNFVSSQPAYYLGGNSNNIAKALASKTAWTYYQYGGVYAVGDTTYANNATGFAAMPAGICMSASAAFLGSYAYFWSATASGSSAWYISLSNLSATITHSLQPQYYSSSVRCVKGAGTLLVCSDTLFSQTDTIMPGINYYWRGKTIYTAGTYFDSLTSVNGCDSIYQLILIAGAYPDCGTVTDYDGNIYNTLQIGNQCWMRENLKTTHYENGTLIQLGSTTSTSVAYRYYPGNSQSNVADYGYLYNWRAIMGKSGSASSNPSGVQGICPNGWHLPSDAEWTELTNYVSSQPSYYLGGNTNNIAKALASKTAWTYYQYGGVYAVGDTTYANNATGFTAMPAGICMSASAAFLGSYAYFWSTTTSSTSAWYISLSNLSATITHSLQPQYYSSSVRCVKGAGTLLACKDSTYISAVSIPYGTTYSWQGQTLSASGTYYSSLTALGGCDSILQLSLTIQPPPFTCGTSTVTDIDGNTYNTIQIGTQCWFKENLRTTKFADGTSIPSSSSTSDTLPYYYSPNNDASLVPTYGRLYNWAAAMHSSSSGSMPVQGACPDYWHLPSNDEWTTLHTYAKSVTAWRCNSNQTYVAAALASQTGWTTTSTSCHPGYNSGTSNNTSGFSLMPAGYMLGSYGSYYQQRAMLWSNTENSSTNAYYTYIRYNNATMYTTLTYSKSYGISVRCIYGTGGRVKVYTSPVTNIGSSSITLGGKVTIDGGNAITARGICWSTSQNPTISNSHTTDGSGLGSFTSTMTGLTAMTPYYVRAYATNSLGTVYGNEIMVVIPNANDGSSCTGTPTVTDKNGNTYNTIQLGNQCWMKENLRATSYSDGTAITYGGSSSTNSTTGYYYYPYGNSSNMATMGLLYNYYAANRGAASSENNPSGVQGVCPTGWHLPSRPEWNQLLSYVSANANYQCGNSYTNNANALCSSSGWNGSSQCYPGYSSATCNATGFTIIASGYYDGSSYQTSGDYGYYWSSYKLSSSGYAARFAYFYTNVSISSRNQGYGCSVRCVKD